MNRKPNLFIVGAPKCGTTAMDQYLSLRPDIFMARKEMHLFGKDLVFGHSFYRRGMAEYLAEFENWKEQRFGGEASVWYLFSKEAAAEIKAFNPDARIIIMLREPVQMLHSMYYSFRWDGNEHLPTFEEALLAQEDRRAGRRIGRQTYFVQGLVYGEIVRYAEQVRRYFNIFGRENVHVIIYDDFAANVGAACRHVLEFLGADISNIPADFKPVNDNKFVKSPAVHALQADGALRSAVLAIRPFMPRVVFNAMQRVDARIRKLNSRPGGRPPMALELRQELQRALAPEVERLSELLGRDLTHWSKDAAPRSSDTSLLTRRAAEAASKDAGGKKSGGQNMTEKSTVWI